MERNKFERLFRFAGRLNGSGFFYGVGLTAKKANLLDKGVLFVAFGMPSEPSERVLNS